MRIKALPKRSTSAGSCLRICNTKRNAVFFPMPGSLENSFTASDISFEGMFSNEMIFYSKIQPSSFISKDSYAQELIGLFQNKV